MFIPSMPERDLPSGLLLRILLSDVQQATAASWEGLLRSACKAFGGCDLVTADRSRNGTKHPTNKRQPKPIGRSGFETHALDVQISYSHLNANLPKSNVIDDMTML